MTVMAYVSTRVNTLVPSSDNVESPHTDPGGFGAFSLPSSGASASHSPSNISPRPSFTLCCESVLPWGLHVSRPSLNPKS